MIEKLLYDKYNIDANSVEKTNVGAGSDTYFIDSAVGKFVMKFPCTSKMNNPINEPDLCQYLLSKNIKVCRFIKNIDNKFISFDNKGRLFHVQKYISGKMYEWNNAPNWLLQDSAETLGKIHSALKQYKGLPEGIGANFFKFMTPQNALNSYKKSRIIAERCGDLQVVSELDFRIENVQKFPDFNIDVTKLTCQATHGDYFISQLICGEKNVNAVIDWTTACVHPVIWEIMRSYVYAAPCCMDGTIDIMQFVEYVNCYLKFADLTGNDIAMMSKLFYYQISVCDYYGQYYNSPADNRNIYIAQAVLSTKLIHWFENNIDILTNTLIKNFR